jgi:hypothetical protein
MAEALEIAAKAGDFARVKAGNEVFIKHVEELIPQFEALVKSADRRSGGARGQRRPEPDRDLLARMLEAAGNYDIDSMQQVMDELERYEYESKGDLIERLKEALLNFQYEEIQERLEEVL